MNKKIATFISFLLALSLSATVYCTLRYIYLEKQKRNLIREEALKKYPSFGYTFKIADKKIISHPLASKMGTFFSEHFMPWEQENINQVLEVLEPHQETLLENTIDEYGHTVNIFLKKEGNDEIQGLQFFNDELKKFNIKDEMKVLILLSLSILFTVCLVVLLLGSLYSLRIETWWRFVFLISSAMLIELCYLWYLGKTVGFAEIIPASPIITKTQESNAIQKIAHNMQRKIDTIPTRVFIEHIEFTHQQCDIFPGTFVTGYIWQHYDINIHKELERNFIIANAYNANTQLLYHQTNGNEETLCWGFSCVLYQIFKPILYPFDQRNILINLLHKNFEKNVVLVPDLDAYEFTKPLELPGIPEKKAIIPYWNITKSFFTTSIHNFQTNLGFKNLAYNYIPYLQFVVTTERKFTGDFVMHFVFLAVILITVFILLLAFLRHGAFKDLIGFSLLGVLGVCSGLLFVLITSEIDLRKTLVTEEIVYLEYLYFVCYAAIMGVIINATLFSMREDFYFINYRDNVIFKLLYWPITLLTIILITAYAFY